MNLDTLSSDSSGIDDVTDLSSNILGKSLKAIPLFMKEQNKLFHHVLHLYSTYIDIM